VTSLRQIMSNRQNALRSTGPKTAEGKKRSSQNALRHGLTAETVVEPVEDPNDYRAFEASVTAAYDAETAVERELVLRLASLLWRLRRAGAIETGLMQLGDETDQHYELLSDKRGTRFTPVTTTLNESGIDPARSILKIAHRFVRLPTHSFALLGRYEASLWRQVRQTILIVERKQRRANAPDWRSRPWRR
jgi:hypothetical protein